MHSTAEVSRLDEMVIEARLPGSLEMLPLAVPAMGDRQDIKDTSGHIDHQKRSIAP
jgi:hypothetical protein